MKSSELTNIDQFYELLSSLKRVNNKIEARKASHTIKKDPFNVFTCLRNQFDEVYLHSRFISNLLDPKGFHGLGLSSISSLLQILSSNINFEDEVEVFPSSCSWKEHHEIDILITDKKSAIIIENKIHARDSNHKNEGQLQRYYRRTIEEDNILPQNIEIYYLTLNGHAPSIDSVSLDKNLDISGKVKCISYGQEIKQWLMKLNPKKSENAKNAINQYITLIDNLTRSYTDYMDSETKQVIDLISQNKETFQSALILLKNRHLKANAIYSLFMDIKDELEKRGYNNVQLIDITTEKAKAIAFNNTQCWPSVHFKDKENHQLAIGAGCDCPGGIYYSLMYKDPKGNYLLSEEEKETLNKIAKNVLDERTLMKDNFEAGNVFLNYCVSNDECINLWDFYLNSTFYIIMPSYRKEIVKKYIDNMEKDLKLVFEEYNLVK